MLRVGQRGVEQGDGDARQVDPLVAGVVVLAAVGVVVAARDVQAVAERLPVAGLEGGELLGACRRSTGRP